MKKLILSLLFPLAFSAQKKEIAFKSYTINPLICNGYQTPSGSLIFIPSDAFQTETGGACGEKVILKYREFHSQTDMYYSGLNMLLLENGKYKILESAGMFEIQAWCGNQKLILKDGKSIQVRMKTRRNIADLKSFIYDSKKNVWNKYEGPVFDFSYFEKNSKADSTSLWGSGKVSAATATWDPEMNGERVFQPGDYAAKLPEGFFKGMNIKNMGIFNYDGVIKDSLAVPMVPQLALRPTDTPFESRIFVTYEGRNTLVYYYPDDFKERFVLLKVKGIKVFTEFKDGSLACTKEGEIDKLDLEALRNKTIKINFDKVPTKPKSEKELAAATGLKTN